MSRTRRILSGTGIAYAHQAALILVGLWLTPFLLRHVGQHALGLWLVVTQLLGYLALLDLGVLAILPREVAVASGAADGARVVGSLVAHVRSIVRWQVLALAVVSATLWWWLPAAWLEVRWPLVTVLVTFVVCYPLRVPGAVLQGMQDLAFLAKVQFAGWALGAAGTVLLVFRGAGLQGLVIGWAIGVALPALAAWWRMRTGFPQIAVRSDLEPVPQYFRRSLWVSVSQIAQVLLSGSDVVLLGRLLGPAAVVPYACTGKLVTVFANHPQLLLHAAQPALSELRASESKAKLARVATALAQAMLIMSGALAIAIVPLNHMFVKWWVGADQYGGAWLTVALVAMMVLRHWNIATIYTLFCFGYERQLSVTGLADGICSVLGTALLVWQLGPVGAPVASMTSVLLVSLPLNTRSVAREMGLTSAGFVRTLAPLLARVGILGAAAIAMSVYWPVQSIGDVVLRFVPLAALYVLLVAPIAWNGPLGPYVRLALKMSRPGEGPAAVPVPAANPMTADR